MPCVAETQICPAVAAGAFVEYHVDTSYEYYFANWYGEMDLVCTPPATIAMMCTVYYVAFGIGGLFNFPVPDLIGRKKAMLLYGAISLGAQLTMLFSNSYWVRLVCFVVIGFVCIKNAVSYVWVFELVETKHKGTVCSVVSMFDEMTPLIFCCYIKFVNKDWFPLVAGMTFAGVVALFLAVVVVPESPKFLLINGKTEEAIAALNRIAGLNCASSRISSDAVFVETQIAGNLDHTLVLAN